MTPTVAIVDAAPEAVAGPALVVFAPSGGVAAAPWFAALDAALDGLLAAALAEGEIDGGAGEAVLFHTGGRLPTARLVVAGLGGTGDAEAIRRAAGGAVRTLQARGVRQAAILPPADDAASVAAAVQALVEGALSAAYRFDRYRTTPSTPFDALTLLAPAGGAEAVALGMRRGRAIGAAVAFARDLCTTPPDDMGPAEVGVAALALAADPRIDVVVHDRASIESLGMGALLGVGRGSHRPPLFIEARYRPATLRAGAKPVVLVGKTVTFDSGGLSLKPALEMDRMKADMGGGAAVLGALQAAAALDLGVEVVALLPVVENMPGGGAIRPGDVLRTLSGLTVEVLNTDAEGRLILADALTYAGRLDPAVVIDVATLTGASAIVFGPVGIGFFANDDALAGTLAAADRTAGERLWRLPLWPEYRPLLHSGVADLANISATLQQGSMMTAATFLSAFVGDWPWAHLDVYNTAWNAADHPTLPKGPTASGTRTLVQWLIERDAAA